MTRALAHPNRGTDEAHRGVVVTVSGGLDCVLRVAEMLRGRRYRVTDLAAEVGDGSAGSEIRASVLVTGDGMGVLLERLRRIPVVVRADTT